MVEECNGMCVLCIHVYANVCIIAGQYTSIMVRISRSGSSTRLVAVSFYWSQTVNKY